MIRRKDKPREKQPVSVAEPKMGRPKKADSDRRDVLVKVLTTETEFRELEQAAQTAGAGVSTWVRMVALERARSG